MLLQILITIGASQALTLASLIWLKKQRTQPDYLLSLQLLLMFCTIISFNYHDQLEEHAPTWTFAAFHFGYLVLPSFYLYIRSAAIGRIDFSKWHNWLHFLPFIGVMLLFTFNFFFLNIEDKRAITQLIMNDQAPLWYTITYYGVFFGVFPFYLYQSMRILRKHERYILTKFSYREEVSLAWLKRFLWCEGLVWIAFLLFEVFAHQFFRLFGSDSGFQIAFIILIANIIYLGIYGLRFHGVFIDRKEVVIPTVEEEKEEESIKYQSSTLSEENAQVYQKNILAYMERERPYLEPKVTIGELATRLQIPVNHLSQVINDQFKQNFFDFVNGYRINAFQKLVQERDLQQFTLLALAYEAGFNSKSSFNAIFKKNVGMTPSEYVKSLNKLPKAKHAV